MIGRFMRWVRERERQAPPAPDAHTWISRDSDRNRSSARWDHVPMTGPYRIWRCDDDDEALVRGCSEHPVLSEAIVIFARLHTPRVGQVAMLYDGDDQVVLGWTDTHHGEHDVRFQWWGCKHAFDMLAVINPVDAAIWEAIAYEGVLNGQS